MSRNNNQVIFITIDTEGDNLWEWKEGDPITTNNLLYLMQFQLLCEKYLIKPIYLMNYEAASDLRWCDFISKKAKEGLCEIGLHLHAWNTPPYYSLPNVLNGNPYITEYPKNVISQKITSTISLIYKNCGIKVKSHRSGRWAYSNEYFEELKKQGICVAVYLLLFFCVQRYLTITGKWFLLSQVITSLLLQTSTSISRGKGKNAIYAFSYFLSAAISISLNIVFVLVLKMGVFGGLLGYSIGPLVAFFFSFLANKEWKYISSSSYSKPKAKELLLFALPLIPNELSWTIIHASDRLIVSKILSVSSNGIISAASKFSSIYTSIFSVFNLAWTEQVIVNYKKDGGKEYINEMFDKMITFFGCLSTLIIALVPFVFNLLINSSFSEAYTIIPLYLVAVFFNAIVGLISAVYIAEGDTKRIAISTIVAALVNISVHLGLVFVIGIYAAPISSIAGYLTITIWRFVDVNKRYCKMRLKIRNVFVLLAALSISAMPYFFGALWVKVLCLALVSIITIILNWKIVIWFFKVFIKKTEKNNTEVKE